MRRKTHDAAFVIVAAAIAVGMTIFGCADQGGSELVPVSGDVSLDGEPLRFGTVTFQPSRGQPARGEINADGEFTLSTYRLGDGATVGRHKVKIACYASQDPAVEKSAKRPTESLGASLIPDHYTRFDTSGIAVAVLAGGNRPFVIELQSESGSEPSQGGAGDAKPAADPQSEARPPAATDDRAPADGQVDADGGTTDSNP